MTTTTPVDFAMNNQMLRAIQIGDWRSAISNRVAIYIHIPFCDHRCSYCDFNIYAGMRSLYMPYAEAIAQEIAATAAHVGRIHVPTIYFGGGTPSLLPAELIGGMLATVKTFFDVDDDAEITLEVNPITDGSQRSAVSGQYFEQLRALGINRLSLGVQSSHERELQLLRRGHSFGDAADTYGAMRDAGFENVNIDLIYGLPQQSIDEWRVTLQRALELKPDHISAYSLQVEEHTAMFNWVRDQRVPSPDEDVVAAMDELAEAMLADEGFEHYEISNWAKRGQRAGGKSCRSRHNLVYWKNEPYFGFGCGAHSSYAGQRYSNVLHPREYIRRVEEGTGTVEEVELIDRALEMGETMMLGLRLIGDGVERTRFVDRFGVELDEVYGSIIDRLIDQGLLESRTDHVRLTRRGRLLGNRVFAEFLPDESQRR